MKIAILVHKLTGGGAERVAAMWANGFSQRGHDVTLILFVNKSLITYNVPEQVSIKYVVSNNQYGIIRRFERIVKLHLTLRKENADVIIDVIPAYWKRIAMCGVSGKKISTEHNSFERPKNATTKAKRINKIYLNRLYDYVTVLTQADMDVIGRQLKHVAVLPNPLALTPVKEMPDKEKIILAVGRLDAGHTKGFDVLIKAFGMTSKDGWTLQIAGSGKQESFAKYKKLAKECGVEDKVKFSGFVDNPLSLYQKASIFVLSSRYEGFGLVLIEAMSQGCACIACDYKGRQKEIVLSERNGLLCEPDNAEALSKAMLVLMQNEKKRREIGLNAIRRSADFLIDRITEKWDVVLNNVFKK